MQWHKSAFCLHLKHLGCHLALGSSPALFPQQSQAAAGPPSCVCCPHPCSCRVTTHHGSPTVPQDGWPGCQGLLLHDAGRGDGQGHEVKCNHHCQVCSEHQHLGGWGGERHRDGEKPGPDLLTSHTKGKAPLASPTDLLPLFKKKKHLKKNKFKS